MSDQINVSERFRFNEATRTIFNPLPAITWKDMAEKISQLADVEFPEDDLPQARSKRLPFCHLWQYSGGLDTEVLRIEPQQRYLLRETEALVFAAFGTNAEMGMVILENNDPTYVKEKTVDGLKRAISFYRVRGRESLIKTKARMEITDDQVKALFHQFLPYFINEALYQFAKAELERVRGTAKSAAAKQSKD